MSEINYAITQLSRFNALLNAGMDIDGLQWEPRKWGSRMPVECSYKHRPSRIGFVKNADGSEYKAEHNSPEQHALAAQLANAQAVWDACQTVIDPHMESLLERILEEGDQDAYKEYVTTWRDFYAVYVEKWPNSKYAHD